MSTMGRDWLSSGSNWKDILSGGVSGFGAGMNQDGGRYYVKSNWKGDGLADVGIGYLPGRGYGGQDFKDMGTRLAGMFGYKGNKGLSGNSLFDNANNLLKGSNALDKYNNVFVNNPNPIQSSLNNYFDNGNGYINYGNNVSDYLDLDNYGYGLGI